MAKKVETPRADMTVREAGKKGGSTTRDRYAGTGYYQKIGRKGGKRTREKHGPEFFETIGKRGGARLAELARRGKAAEAGE